MRSRTTDDLDRELRKAIDRTGYYPEVVADGVRTAVAGEQVLAYFLHPLLRGLDEGLREP